MVREFLNGGDWSLTGEFTEVESGKRKDRPQLDAALALCRLTGATLIVAKLDRLARDTGFLLAIKDRTGEGGIVFCDLPNIGNGAMGKFIVTQMAAVAELEAGLISKRTKDALAAAKAKGTVLGGYRGGPKIDPTAGLKARQERAATWTASVRPIVMELRTNGRSLRGVCEEMEQGGIRTPRGGKWVPAMVMRIEDAAMDQVGV